MLPTLEEALRSRETLRAHHIEAIDAQVVKEGYNDDNIFYEYDLRELWYKLIQGAKITDAKHPAQDRLAAEVLHAREMEALTSGGKIWGDLPFFVEQIYEHWKKGLELPVRQRRNLSAFIARLASWGVRDPALCWCAIWILREALETPRPLVSTAAGSPIDQLPIADMVPAAVVWFELCGYKIESLCLASHDFDDSTIGSLAKDHGVHPETGFSISRWRFWKKRLDELSRSDLEETAAFALRGANSLREGMGGKNVVIASLPYGVYGTTSATSVVTQMRLTFPFLRLGLVVGIGGGVPNRSTDIRLGDVVVSVPNETSGGVIQYDYGKTCLEGSLQRTGALNKPPQILLTALTRMAGDTMLPRSQTGRFPSDYLQIIRTKQKDFGRPANDWLFHSTYDHQSSRKDCSSCDKNQLVQRAPRANDEPCVHYGLIASGNQLMKDARTRDAIARELNVLCFEMEAAGIMDQLPCLVVRGICDYCDSHKSDEWQQYAALTAAVYSKALLSIVPPVKGNVAQDQVLEITEEGKACMQKLFKLITTDSMKGMNALKQVERDRTPGTCSWILQKEELKCWVQRDRDIDGQGLNMLWLYGNPGTGKSTMAITLAEELPRTDYFSNGDRVLASFFCDSGSEFRRMEICILRGLLYQIISQYPPFLKPLLSKYRIQGKHLFTSFDALWALLLDIGRVPGGPEIYCIIDALDECNSDSQETLLRQIDHSFNNPRPTCSAPSSIHLLILSRPYPELEQYLSAFKSMDLGSCREITNDLRAMIKDRVEGLARRRKYPKSVFEKVSQILEEKAAGTFLWVGIACAKLARVQSRRAVETLQALPQELHSLYRKLLLAAVSDCDEDDHRVVMEILGFVAFAQRPLTIIEMAEACRLYLDTDMESRLQFTRELIELCRLLIVIDNGHVRLLHSSVRDFLLLEIQEINAMRTNYTLSCRCIETILHKSQPAMDKSELDPEKGFLCYSVLYWPEHVRLSQTEFAIREEFKDFFQIQLETWGRWLDYYSYLKGSSYRELCPGLAPIHVAAHWGILPLISFLLPASLEDKDSRGQTPLLIAAQAVQIEAMRFLVERGSYVNSVNNYHENALHITCQNSQYNNCAMTKFLLDRGTSPYVCDKENMTPFLYAIGHQKEDLARVFLQNGFYVDFRIRRRCWTGRMVNNSISYEVDHSPEQHSNLGVQSGLTALHFSALNTSAKMATLLLQYGADPNARSDTGDTPLHLAIRPKLLEHKYHDPWISGEYAAESLRDLITDYESEAYDVYESIDRYRVHIIEVLLSSDSVDVNLANDQGDYPQHVIPFERDYASSILCKLVAKGADSSRLNGAGQSCLHLASKAGNLEVVRKLVNGGHDILMPDIDGLSPFHYALRGRYLQVVRFMSTACESLLSKTWRSLDHFGKNPLHHHVSSIFCSAEMIDFLVQCGCNVNDVDREGNSALSLYMSSSHLYIDREIFQLLLDKGADPLCVNHHKENLAHLFMHYREEGIGILQILLKCGVDLAARDLEGRTVMHHGAIHGVFDHHLGEFLREHGVLDPNVRDFQNKTPLDYAEEQSRRTWPQDYSGLDDRWDRSFNCLKFWSHFCIA
ncbi:hypothetical protein KXW75_005350 [Aspergillus fumigatus]|nr:hypothetical protein CNMCM8689_004411 [Aspergillus fumigatus]KAH1419671.1 hypothetical protein KXX64_001292 [Aspergillus fumigatus]KAH1847777.1 hypothetical protein KXX54_008508 [Aspergillus fumigatus]KAH1875711.1 hypothetical protein KXX01_006218 [Aspergillus fumigatus]KAH2114585.1 hypothetical protein KXW75_005350 [Aspergillus fumigatus]